MILFYKDVLEVSLQVGVTFTPVLLSLFQRQYPVITINCIIYSNQF